MGITFSSPEIQNIQNANAGPISFTESYAFAATNTKDFGFPATISYPSKSMPMYSLFLGHPWLILHVLQLQPFPPT
jgi:hypothetical protein